MPPLTKLYIFFLGSSERGVDCQIPVSTLRRLLLLKESLIDFGVLFCGTPARFAGEDWSSPCVTGRWTQEHIDVFRQLTRLENLHPFSGRWSDEELVMLCAEPAPAHLHSLSLNSLPTTDAGIEALVRLPLTEMTFMVEPNPKSSDLVDLSFLGRMSSLERVQLYCDFAHIELRSSTGMRSLLHALASCTQLTTFDLSDATLTDGHLCRVLPSLPNLRHLTLRPSDIKLGLSFASTVEHLATTLETLIFADQVTTDRRMAISIDQLHHLYALRNLRRLTLSVAFLPTTPAAAITQAIAEFSSDSPTTFRRDRWPHMIHSELYQADPEESIRRLEQARRDRA